MVRTIGWLKSILAIERAKDYAKKLLKDCKAWGGPCASCEDLLAVLSSRTDKPGSILKTEMAHYAQTHKQEKIQAPDLFRINKITYEETLENLMILLSDKNQVSTASIANSPSNNDVLKALCTLCQGLFLIKLQA